MVAHLYMQPKKILRQYGDHGIIPYVLTSSRRIMSSPLGAEFAISLYILCTSSCISISDLSIYAYNNSDNNHHNHDGMPDIMATI